MKGVRHQHYEIPDLPSETLYEVAVEEKRRPERIRAQSEEQARDRIRNLLGLTPTGVEEVDEDE